jgi:hypothetical protein
LETSPRLPIDLDGNDGRRQSRREALARFLLEGKVENDRGGDKPSGENGEVVVEDALECTLAEDDHGDLPCGVRREGVLEVEEGVLEDERVGSSCEGEDDEGENDERVGCRDVLCRSEGVEG